MCCKSKFSSFHIMQLETVALICRPSEIILSLKTTVFQLSTLRKNKTRKASTSCASFFEPRQQLKCTESVVQMPDIALIVVYLGILKILVATKPSFSLSLLIHLMCKLLRAKAAAQVGRSSCAVCSQGSCSHRHALSLSNRRWQQGQAN